MSRFINFYQFMKSNGARHPFLNSNTDRSGTEGTHWWGNFRPSSKNKSFYLINLVFLD